jgi:hypothetical protein
VEDEDNDDDEDEDDDDSDDDDESPARHGCSSASSTVAATRIDARNGDGAHASSADAVSGG